MKLGKAFFFLISMPKSYFFCNSSYFKFIPLLLSKDRKIISLFTVTPFSKFEEFNQNLSGKLDISLPVA